MNLYEVEAKRLFSRFGIPTDLGVLLTAADEPPEDVRFPCVVKAQMLGAKRGEVGGIRFAQNRAQLIRAIADIRKITVGTTRVDGVLIAPTRIYTREHYLSIALDEANGRVMLIYTPCGRDLEQSAAAKPQKLLMLDLTGGFDAGRFSDAIAPFVLCEPIAEQLADIAGRLYALFCAVDAAAVEIDPLSQTVEKTLVASNAKVVLAKNAAAGSSNILQTALLEQGACQAAHEAGLSVVELEAGGNIGVLAAMAGIGMATADTVREYGGVPVNVMILGSGAGREKTCEALTLLLSNPKVEGILISVAGSAQDGRAVAEGVRDAFLSVPSKAAVVVKGRSALQETGWDIYEELGLWQVRHGTPDEAVKLLMAKLEEKAS